MQKLTRIFSSDSFALLTLFIVFSISLAQLLTNASSMLPIYATLSSHLLAV